MEVPIIPEPIHETLKQIDGSIIRRGMRGKFPAGTTMHGEITVPTLRDYTTYPTELDHRRPENGFLLKTLLFLNIVHNSPLLSETEKSRHFFIRQPGPESSLETISLIMRARGLEMSDSRPTAILTSYILPSDRAQQLEELVRQTPDGLVDFYHIAAGLDKTDNKPGIVRNPSDEAVIVNLDGLISEEIFKKNGYNPPVYYKYLKTLPQNSSHLRYSKPL